MPRTRFDKQRNHELAVLLNGCVHAFGGNVQEAAEKLGMGRKTLGSRLAKPGDFTVDELLHFARVYNISIEDLRAAIRK